MNREVPTSRTATRLPGAAWRGDAEVAVLDALAPAVLRDPEGSATGPGVLQDKPWRAAGRAALGDGSTALVKFHRGRGIRDLLRAWVRGGNRGVQEWRATRYLDAAGMPVPRALAHGRRREGWREATFFVSRYLPGTVDLAHLALEQRLDALALRRLRLAAVRLARGLHDAGFDHLDLHAGNLLVDSEQPDPAHLVVIDLHRAHLGRPVGSRGRTRGLAQLVTSFLLFGTRTDRWRYARAYLPPGAPRPDVRRLFQRLDRICQRSEETRIQSRAARCLATGSDFTRELAPGDKGARSRVITVERLEGFLRAHDEALAANDARVRKRSRKGCVTAHGDVVVKERRPTSAFHRWRDRMAPARHQAGYRNAHELRVRGVPTPAPLAWVRRGGRILSVFEDISHHPRLDHHLMDRTGPAHRAERRHLVRWVAAWLAWLHRRGIYHGDLKAVNLRLETLKPGPGVLLHLIDTDHVVMGAEPVSRRRRIKNLAQLAASIPRVVTRSDRLRFLRAHVHALPLAGTEREILREVQAHLDGKRLVEDEPFE